MNRLVTTKLKGEALNAGAKALRINTDIEPGVSDFLRKAGGLDEAFAAAIGAIRGKFPTSHIDGLLLSNPEGGDDSVLVSVTLDDAKAEHLNVIRQLVTESGTRSDQLTEYVTFTI